MNPTPLDSIYIWVSFSLFPLESSGQAAYMKTHPKCTMRQCLSNENGDQLSTTFTSITMSSKLLWVGNIVVHFILCVDWKIGWLLK